MQSKKVTNGFVIRLTRGEELLETLQKFCQENQVTSGWFTGFGGATHVKIAYFDLEKKEYITKEFEEPLEVTNLTGNVAQRDGATVFHVHGTFGRTDYSAIAGHLDHLSVGATLEIYLVPFAEQLERKKDEEIGLPLLNLM